MLDVRTILTRLVDDLEHANSLGLASIAIDEVLPPIREALDVYCSESLARASAERVSANPKKV